MAAVTEISRPPPESDLEPIDGYRFPTARLTLAGLDPAREPLVLVLCGAFSPITYAHLRMVVLGADEASRGSAHELIAVYLSPVGDGYPKPGLVAAIHRLAMTEIAVQSSRLIMVDSWESRHAHGYVPTDRVLAHFDREINGTLGGAVDRAGGRRCVRIGLLAGFDLVQSMQPPLWADDELEAIIGRHGVWVVDRVTGSDADTAARLAKLEARWGAGTVHRLIQPVPNEVSSSRVRQLLAQGCSVEYLVPDGVIEYFMRHKLYAGTT